MTIIQKIESQNCGCEVHGSKNLISIDQALARISRTFSPINGTEKVWLADASGRVLAASVRAMGMVPPFANSAMDGYAVNTADLAGDGPWDLLVTGRIAAGQLPPTALINGTAMQIFTGAPVPDGANAVIMQEDVQRTTAGIEIRRKITPRTHIRAAGEDMTKGKTVVPAGRCLTARDIAACAAAGHATVMVQRKLKVALVVTGDEVCQPGETRGKTAIWDVNTPMLCATMGMSSVDLCAIQSATDTRQGLKAQIATLADQVDLVVTTGGISVGEEDHVKPAISDLNAKITFSGVAIKPGKPISVGQVGKAAWLGLPGNPLSAFVTWQLFGTALCRALTGLVSAHIGRRHVVLSEPLCHKPGRCELRLAYLAGFDDQGREVATAATATHSGRVAALPDADGLLFIPADAKTLPAGALVEFLTFH
jgi:molybdopterin molybdotransferase